MAGRKERDPGEMPLAPRNLSRFFSSPSYYNTALLYLRDDAARMSERGQERVDPSVVEIARFRWRLLVFPGLYRGGSAGARW